MKITCFSRLRTPDYKTDILELGKKRRNFWILGKIVTVRRLGFSGQTTGSTQARWYVCDESEKRVLAGPFCRLRHADSCVSNMFRIMQVELPLSLAPDVID